MPFIRVYSEGEVGEEDKIVMPPRELPMEIAFHETIHIVVLRLDGLDIADVVDQDDAAWTRLVEPQKFTVAALMAPEVYMRLNGIVFTDLSVSSDRDAVANCFRAEAVEDIRKANRELLEIIFQCPALSFSARLRRSVHEITPSPSPAHVPTGLPQRRDAARSVRLLPTSIEMYEAAPRTCATKPTPKPQRRRAKLRSRPPSSPSRSASRPS
jgi:hypothetical protein